MMASEWAPIRRYSPTIRSRDSPAVPTCRRSVWRGRPPPHPVSGELPDFQATDVGLEMVAEEALVLLPGPLRDPVLRYPLDTELAHGHLAELWVGPLALRQLRLGQRPVSPRGSGRVPEGGGEYPLMVGGGPLDHQQGGVVLELSVLLGEYCGGESTHRFRC
jgi:hypothetical protein